MQFLFYLILCSVFLNSSVLQAASMAATLSFPPFPLDRQGSTRMLKDFLQETNANGITSSKFKPASFKALAIHAVVAAVKRISFPSMKSPKIFPRSLSRRLLRKTERNEREIGGDFVVKIKDIIRWKSFRDLVDETAAAPSLDFADSPDRYTAAATTTTTTTTTGSYSSSWCESDFMAEDLPSPSWRDWSEDGGDGAVGKMHFPCVGEDSMETTVAFAENDKKVNINALSRRDDNKEQNVLDKSTKWVLEDVEEAISLPKNGRLTQSYGMDRLLLEFIRRELAYVRDDDERVRNDDKIRRKKGKEEEDGQDWFLSHKGKETYMREMEREGKWEVFGVEEKIELGLQFEGEILGCLVDEILLDTLQL
ncbi:uncharacterized protein LOC120072365 [Benincasa hispida]|uniref:uncharacterized protein LOC120072365 n=1 Tax=Benincasa hispida TaxID=102211 RepID=UPI001901967E|nr:uncharacterized protein LOC120072365 [Benincasa hispida]